MVAKVGTPTTMRITTSGLVPRLGGASAVAVTWYEPVGVMPDARGYG
jgi:hypothetical protein